ncbi:hypothetical protein KEM55_008466 [Ascosphaera atra]|nr:hypothetical protein KEM55_008466 [Ascosphaera atra]
MHGAAPVDNQTGEDPDQANQELDNVFDDLNEQPQTQHVVKLKYYSKSAEKQRQQPPEESEDDAHDDDDEQPELDEHVDDHQQKQHRENDQQRPAKSATPRSARRIPKTPNLQQQRQSRTPSTRKPTTQRHLPPSSNPLSRTIALRDPATPSPAPRTRERGNGLQSVTRKNYALSTANLSDNIIVKLRSRQRPHYIGTARIEPN